jgi:nitrite reductase/ring-hydroxylating ferredoxin subunit
MSEPTDGKLNRRDFVKLTFGWCAALFAAGASAAAGARFMVPNVLYEPDQRYKALKPEDYPQGMTFLPEIRTFLIRSGDKFRAVSAVCTHLGCTVNPSADGKGFHCPCHGSQFNEDGAVVGGPAPKPLPCPSVSLSRDGRLVIDASQQVPPTQALVV